MKIDRILQSGLLFCLATFAACSSDNDEQPQTPPTFPEKQTLSIPVGETLQVSFDAEREWRMTSDMAWVRFLAGDPAEEMPIASGPAGTNTVTLLMKTDRHRFAYADSILAAWYKAGVHHVADIARLDSSYQKERASRPARSGSTAEYNSFMHSSYDFDALEEALLKQ